MKKLIIPCSILSKIGMDGERELLISNGFSAAIPFHAERDMPKFVIVYTQEDGNDI